MNTTTNSSLSNRAPRAASSPPAQGGFTLVEVLVVLAIASLLVTLAIPGMSRFVHSARLTDASNALLSSLQLARSEAMKRKDRVTVCKSADGLTCSTSGGWEQGWIVFHDANHDGDRSADERIIERGQPRAGSLRITGNSQVARYVSFLAWGGTRQLSGSIQAGTVTLCDISASELDARQIVVSAAGRSRVVKVQAMKCA
jgi:type IV fimbrial biogenesis protein FimT